MNSNFPFIKAGSIIDVIAPSSGVPREEIDTSIQQIIDLAAIYGFKARIDSKIIVPAADPFSANIIAYRQQALIDALNNTDSDAVWCIRGGYGVSQLIPPLEKIKKPSKVKLFAGFSDITPLHLFLQKQWQWPTLHSKVLWQLINKSTTTETEIKELIQLITGNLPLLKYEIKPLNNLAKTIDKISAEVIGGNLSLLQCSIGTSWQIEGKNKIILLEDVDERGYRIDRMLYHMEEAGVFKNPKAVLIGDITCKAEPNGLMLCEDAIGRFIDRTNIPIFRIAGIGHEKVNNPLPLGIIANISKNSEYHIEFPL